jgi:hypothetical protein
VVVMLHSLLFKFECGLLDGAVVETEHARWELKRRIPELSGYHFYY